MRLIRPYLIVNLSCYMRHQTQRIVLGFWLIFETIVNILFLLFPVVALKSFTDYGCLKDKTKNRVTFIPLKGTSKFLYYESTNALWNNPIKQIYGNEYRTVPLDLQLSDTKNDNQTRTLCHDDRCPVYNTRFEIDLMIWLFRYIGYIAIVDFVVNLLRVAIIHSEFGQFLTDPPKQQQSHDEYELKDQESDHQSNHSNRSSQCNWELNDIFIGSPENQNEDDGQQNQSQARSPNQMDEALETFDVVLKVNRPRNTPANFKPHVIYLPDKIS